MACPLLSIAAKGWTCWRDLAEAKSRTTLPDFIEEFMKMENPTFKTLTPQSEFRILTEWDKEAEFRKAIFLPM